MPLSTPYFTSFTGGQTIIPVGTQAFSVDVVSGSAYVNGTLYLAGQSLSWKSPDSKMVLGSEIAVGGTGAANRVTVFYAQ